MLDSSSGSSGGSLLVEIMLDSNPEGASPYERSPLIYQRQQVMALAWTSWVTKQ